MAYVHRLRVRFNECDVQGVVFNANYLVFADVAANELWRDELGGYHEFVAGGHDIVAAEANVRFLGPARFDDELECTVTVDRIGTTSFVQRTACACDGAPVAEVVLRYVCVGREGRPTPLPGDLRERLGAHLTDPVGAASGPA